MERALREGPDPLLVVAGAASLALAAATAHLPPFPGRLALAVLGGVWAPGYALVALIARRGRLAGLERHALASAAGLLLLPLAGLVASETIGFGAAQVASLLAGLTLLLALLAAYRGGTSEAAVRAPLPDTRATLAIAGGALALAALVLAPSFLEPTLPSAFAMTTPGGGEVPVRWQAGEAPTYTFQAMAGSAPVEGVLVVTWTPVPDGEVRTLLEAPLALAAGEGAARDVAPPANETGTFRLAARWDGHEVRVLAHVLGGKT